MLKRFVNRVSKYPEVQLITVRGNQITVVVQKAKAKIYLHVNNLMEKVNQKQFYGESLEATVKDRVDKDELSQMLSDPGVAYVRQEVFDLIDEVPGNHSA